MTITVEPATAAEEPIVRNLVQFYAYDFGEAVGWDLPPSGRYPDTIVDGAFHEGGPRHPFLLRVDAALAGFAIVDRGSRLTADPDVHDMAELFLTRRHRGRGAGETAVRALFERFGGRWEVRVAARNAPAQGFWRKVIGRYSGGAFEERRWDEARWRGPVFTFAAPRGAGVTVAD